MKYIKKARERDYSTKKELRDTVTAIIDEVRERGDKALREFGERFDGCKRDFLRVGREEIDAAYAQVSDADVEDMKLASENIRRFSGAQKECIRGLDNYAQFPGAELGHRVMPVESCCCYVPGGGYPLYSTAMMLVIPAKTAGVKRVCACSPVMKGTGSIHPKTLVAMDVAGADEIYALGGAQAVAAFTYGTEEISPVDLIVGPGNSFVTEAKRQCYGDVGIDFIAGPSEVLVIADDTGDAEIIALDILAQSEHDPVAKGILISTSEKLCWDVIAQVEKELQSLSTAGIAQKSWEDFGEVILAESLDEAAKLSNKLAPEHLEIQTADDEALMEKLTSYGALFMGKYSAEVFGDYASGTNHTLPTMRASRFTGGVWAGTFLRVCTHQRFSREAMLQLEPVVTRMARGEGLEAHALASQRRGERYLKQSD